jgi:hypothetical protein
VVELFVEIFLGDKLVSLEAGDHTIPFSVPFPGFPSLPGSFVSPLGAIYYHLCVYRQDEWDGFYVWDSVPISVKSYMNLSSWKGLSLSQPVSYVRSEKSLAIFSWKKTPPFKFIFKMVRSDYTTEENIPFELEIENPSSYEIERIVVSLIQRIKYNATYSWGKVQQKIIFMKEKIQQKETPTGSLWKDKLKIPQSIHPNQKGMIHISYCIKVSALFLI